MTDINVMVRYYNSMGMSVRYDPIAEQIMHCGNIIWKKPKSFVAVTYSPPPTDHIILPSDSEKKREKIKKAVYRTF